jgi:hypothetical protein
MERRKDKPESKVSSKKQNTGLSQKERDRPVIFIGGEVRHNVNTLSSDT